MEVAKESGRLYVVATPIGNMEDITLRALRVLGECAYILAEDTRVTGKLLKKHSIENKLCRYDAHSHQKNIAKILADLSEGEQIALVSDAGTPGVSDPGVLLVEQVRAEGFAVVAVPGPSALTATMSIAGCSGNQFCFLGFVPQKKGRQTFFAEIASYDVPVVFFESTHRIMKTLASLADRDYFVTVARELTKLHEEVVKGTGEEVLAYFKENAEHQRGEFVLVVTSRQ